MIRTKHYPSLLKEDRSTYLYDFLMTNITWTDGIYSRKVQKPSRKAYQVDPSSQSEVDSTIMDVVRAVCGYTSKDSITQVEGVYVNYYRDGIDFCPTHRHQGTRQIVIYLGATRTLKVGKKDYNMQNGDVIVFGGSNHGVRQEPEVTDGRISIAVFTRLRPELNHESDMNGVMWMIDDEWM